MGKKIVRMEQALSVWEDTCYLLRKRMELVSLKKGSQAPEENYKGPILCAKDFRKSLLENGGSGEFDYEKFVGSMGLLISELGDVGFVPIHLFSWNRYSRRVFSLPAGLQTLLSVTSLEGYKWKDVKWPFDSFLISLGEPIGDEHVNFDHILVSDLSKIFKSYEDGQIINLLCFSTELDKYQPLKDFAMKKNLRKWNIEKLVKKIQYRKDNFFESVWLSISAIKDEPVNKPFDDFRSEGLKVIRSNRWVEQDFEYNNDLLDADVLDKLINIVVNTCFFLQTLPPKKTINSQNAFGKAAEEQSTVQDSCNPSISESENIFMISCESTLSKESQETIAEIRNSRENRLARVHWRRGHWRRIWGSRDNLDAPKIWIRPCLVNLNRLLPNTLPLASQTNLE